MGRASLCTPTRHFSRLLVPPQHVVRQTQAQTLHHREACVNGSSLLRCPCTNITEIENIAPYLTVAVPSWRNRCVHGEKHDRLAAWECVEAEA